MMGIALLTGITSAFAFSEKHHKQGAYRVYVSKSGSGYHYSDNDPFPLSCLPQSGAACSLNTDHTSDYFNAVNATSFPPEDPFGNITGATIIYEDRGNIYR